MLLASVELVKELGGEGDVLIDGGSSKGSLSS